MFLNILMFLMYTTDFIPAALVCDFEYYVNILCVSVCVMWMNMHWTLGYLGEMVHVLIYITFIEDENAVC